MITLTTLKLIFIQPSSLKGCKFWSGKNIAVLFRTTLNLSTMAFTQSPPLSNNPKILINYLIFTESIQWNEQSVQTRQSKQCGFSIYTFDNLKSKSMVRLVRAEKMVLPGLVFARKIARMILIQNI